MFPFGKLIIPSENEKSKRPTSYYNLPLILEVGRRLKSPIVSIFKSWCNDILNPQIIEQPSNIIKFDNGIISLDVRVEPDEETVWLNQEQLALLFDTTKANISMHISNIYDSGEIEKGATVKDFLIVQNEGGRSVSRFVSHYNLDMIISLGYRINTRRGIEFRKWATRVLKTYLINGYVIDSNRVNITPENYLNLVNLVLANTNDIAIIKEKEKYLIIEQKVILDGEVFDAKVIFNQIIETAKESLILLDPYVDILTLDFFKNKKIDISLLLITSSKARIQDNEINDFQAQYGEVTKRVDDRYHDRYLIIDRKMIYHLGASVNYLGKKLSQISLIEDEDVKETILSRLE